MASNEDIDCLVIVQVILRYLLCCAIHIFITPCSSTHRLHIHINLNPITSIHTVLRPQMYHNVLLCIRLIVAIKLRKKFWMVWYWYLGRTLWSSAMLIRRSCLDLSQRIFPSEAKHSHRFLFVWMFTAVENAFGHSPSPSERHPP